MNSGPGTRLKQIRKPGAPSVCGWGAGGRGLACREPPPPSILGERMKSLPGFCVFSLELFLHTCTRFASKIKQDSETCLLHLIYSSRNVFQSCGF